MAGQGSVMDKMNSKLYLQNCIMMKENERLRKKAQMLNRENQALLYELKQRLAVPKPGNPTGNNIPGNPAGVIIDLNSPPAASSSSTNAGK